MTESKRLKILCDMDGVLCDLTPTWVSMLGAAHAEYVHPDKIVAYDFAQFVTNRERFDACLPQALLHAPPMRGSLAFEELSQVHNVILTTYVHPAAEEHGKLIKYRWLKAWFPEAIYDIEFIGVERGDIKADLLIDDSPENITRFLDKNPTSFAFLIDHAYNQKFERGRCTRLRSVREVLLFLKMLANMEAKANEL